jgi:hypothetical protein
LGDMRWTSDESGADGDALVLTDNTETRFSYTFPIFYLFPVLYRNFFSFSPRTMTMVKLFAFPINHPESLQS